MKALLLLLVVSFLAGVTPGQQSKAVVCKADESGPNWYFRGEIVLRDGKPVDVTQFVSASGTSKIRAGFSEFLAGQGEKKGWIRFDTVQNTRGMRPSITLFSPGLVADETVASYLLKLKVGNETLTEVVAEDSGWHNGWPTGTTRILSATISDPVKLGPIFRALDKAEAITVESYGVFVDRSVSELYSSAFTVQAESLRNARAAASGVRVKIDAAVREGKCTS